MPDHPPAPDHPADPTAWLGELRCPSCDDPFDVAVIPTPALGRGVWGTLRCRCATYPVIDDVPVLLRDRVALNSTGQHEVLDEGPAVADLVEQIGGADPIQALVRLLATAPLPWPLGRIGAVHRLAGHPSASRVLSRVAGGRVRQLLARRDTAHLEEVLAGFYLHGLHVGHDYSYFLMRASQPRQLAFLGMLETVPPGRVLDVGCGLGHHSWSLSLTGHEVRGLDYNFAQLWMARWWVATAARFVCTDVTRRLPFTDDDADAAWFADSIDLVPDPPVTIAEMQRCAGDGPVFLARIGTSSRSGLYPTARPLAHWRRVLAEAGPHRLLDEQTLAEAYLAGRLPDYRADDPDDVLAQSTNVFAVLTDDPGLLVDHGPVPHPPPHARGHLIINPIYAPVGPDLRHLRLQLPSDWFGFEDGELFRFHDFQVVLTHQDVSDLRRQQLTPGLLQLVDRFVVVGAPDRYIGRQRRRFKQRVYQATTSLLPGLVRIPDVEDPTRATRPLGLRRASATPDRLDGGPVP